jgi:hypothetical protein
MFKNFEFVLLMSDALTMCFQLLSLFETKDFNCFNGTYSMVRVFYNYIGYVITTLYWLIMICNFGPYKIRVISNKIKSLIQYNGGYAELTDHSYKELLVILIFMFILMLINTLLTICSALSMKVGIYLFLTLIFSVMNFSTMFKDFVINNKCSKIMLSLYFVTNLIMILSLSLSTHNYCFYISEPDSEINCDQYFMNGEVDLESLIVHNVTWCYLKVHFI